MSYAGNNPAICRLQMELMYWSFTLVHRNANWVMDADYWSRISENIHIDPLLAQYTSLAQTLYKKYEPPTGEITQDTLPGFRKVKEKSTSGLIYQVDTQPYMENFPIRFGQDNSKVLASTLHNSISAQAFQAQHFSWILHGITNCHFQSSIKLNNIPFQVEAICEQNICSRAIAQSYFKCDNIFDTRQELRKYIMTLGTRVHGYYTTCPDINESSRQRDFLRQELITISHILAKAKLQIVVTQFPNAYDRAMILTFKRRLSNLDWVSYLHELQFTQFGDAIDDKSRFLISIHKSASAITKDIEIIVPPQTDVSINQHIYAPFNEEKYSIYTSDMENSAYKIKRSSDVSVNKNTCLIKYHILPKDLDTPTLTGTNVYSRDYPAPPLQSYNHNAFGKLFGVEFKINSKNHIREISKYEYASCFCLDNNLTSILAKDANTIGLLYNAIPGNTSQELFKAIHHNLFEMRNSNTEIIFPEFKSNQVAPAATIYSLLNGSTSIKLPDRYAWESAYEKDEECSLMIKMIKKPSTYSKRTPTEDT